MTLSQDLSSPEVMDELNLIRGKDGAWTLEESNRWNVLIMDQFFLPGLSQGVGDAKDKTNEELLDIFYDIDGDGTYDDYSQSFQAFLELNNRVKTDPDVKVQAEDFCDALVTHTRMLTDDDARGHAMARLKYFLLDNPQYTKQEHINRFADAVEHDESDFVRHSAVWKNHKLLLARPNLDAGLLFDACTRVINDMDTGRTYTHDFYRMIEDIDLYSQQSVKYFTSGMVIALQQVADADNPGYDRADTALRNIAHQRPELNAYPLQRRLRTSFKEAKEGIKRQHAKWEYRIEGVRERMAKVFRPG